MESAARKGSRPAYFVMKFDFGSYVFDYSANSDSDELSYKVGSRSECLSRGERDGWAKLLRLFQLEDEITPRKLATGFYQALLKTQTPGLYHDTYPPTFDHHDDETRPLKRAKASISEFDCNEDEKETRVEKSPVGHENEDNDDSHNDDESDDSENNENDEDVDRIESFILAVGSEGSDLLALAEDIIILSSESEERVRSYPAAMNITFSLRGLQFEYRADEDEDELSYLTKDGTRVLLDRRDKKGWQALVESFNLINVTAAQLGNSFYQGLLTGDHIGGLYHHTYACKF